MEIKSFYALDQFKTHMFLGETRLVLDITQILYHMYI